MQATVRITFRANPDTTIDMSKIYGHLTAKFPILKSKLVKVPGGGGLDKDISDIHEVRLLGMEENDASSFVVCSPCTEVDNARHLLRCPPRDGFATSTLSLQLHELDPFQELSKCFLANEVFRAFTRIRISHGFD